MTSFGSIDVTLMRSMAGMLATISKQCIGVNGKPIWRKSIENGSALESGGFIVSSKLFLLEFVDLFRDHYRGIWPDTQVKSVCNILVTLLTDNRDGGWMRILLVSLLLQYGLERDRNISHIIRGFTVALEICQELLTDTSTRLILPVQWSDIAFMNMVVSSVIRPKGSLFRSSKIENFIRDIVLNAFLLQDNQDQTTDNIHLPQILYQLRPGRSPADSRILYNTLVMEIPIPRDLHYGDDVVVNATIAVFNCSLEFPEFSQADSFDAIDLTGTNEEDSFESVKQAERRSLIRFALSLLRNNVKIIACQKRLHPYLQRVCCSVGIVCLQRVSARYIGALVRLTGGAILGSYAPIVNTEQLPRLWDSLGFVSELKAVYDCGKIYIQISSILPAESKSVHLFHTFCSNAVVEKPLESFLERTAVKLSRFFDDSDSSVERGLQFAQGVQNRRQSMHTIVVASRTISLCVELQEVFEKCFQTLGILIASPTVVKGAGCWQQILGEALKTKYTAEATRRGKKYHPRGNDCILCDDRMSKLHLDALSAIGIFADILIRCSKLLGPSAQMPFDTSADPLAVEPLSNAFSSLQRAVEVSVTMLELDGIVFAIPRTAATFH